MHVKETAIATEIEIEIEIKTEINTVIRGKKHGRDHSNGDCCDHAMEPTSPPQVLTMTTPLTTCIPGPVAPPALITSTAAFHFVANAASHSSPAPPTAAMTRLLLLLPLLAA